MTENYHDRIDALMEQAWRMGYTPARLALQEEAVRLADSHHDLEEGFDLRDALIDTAVFTGTPEKALVAFSWMLGHCDRDPERFHEAELMWKYKWMVNEMDSFPRITLEQIDAAFADMETRYKRCGLSLKPVWKERVRMAKAADKRDEADEYYRRWRDAQPDYNNDCSACDRNFRVNYLIYLEQFDQALEYALPLLDRREGCSTVPHTTYANVLLPLVQLGEIEQALTYHHIGYPMIRGNQRYIHESAKHIIFLVLAGDHNKAVHLFEQHLPWALDTMKASEQFLFCLASRFLLLQLTKRDLTLRLPKSFALYSEGGKYGVSQLQHWFDEEARQLASEFDHRNGTDYFTRRLGYPEGKWQALVQTNSDRET